MLGFEPAHPRPGRDRRDRRRRSRRSASAIRFAGALQPRDDAASQPIPLFDLRLERERRRGGRRRPALRLADHGARAPRRSRRAFAEHLGVAARRRVARAARRRCTSPTSPPASGPGDEVIVPGDHLRGHRRGRPLLRRRRRCSPTSVGPHDLGLDPDDVERRADHGAHEGGLRRALRRLPGGRRALRELCDAHGLALIEDAAHAPSAPHATAAASSARSGSPARSRSSPTRCCPAARAACWPPTTTRWPRWRAAALARDDLGHLGPPPRPRDRLRRRRRRASTTGSTSRGPRCCSRGSPALEADIAAPARARAPLPRAAGRLRRA